LNNPIPDKDMVFPHVQLWTGFVPKDGVSRTRIRLTEGKSLRTEDRLFIKNSSLPSEYYGSEFLFDGINAHHKAIFVKNWDNRYQLFVCTRSKKRGQRKEYNDIEPMFTGKGTVTSLMLESDRNRFVWTVDEGSLSYKLYIKNIPTYDKPYYTNCSHTDTHVKIARIDQLFLKIVNLGRDTYFGITDKGLLYSLWLEKNGILKLAMQRCSLLFKDIAVDNTVVTEKGYHPKIAFLTKTGEIHIAHLAEYNHPTLLYFTTIPNAQSVSHFYYNDGKLLVVYYSIISEYSDNFDLLYGCSLLRKLYKNYCHSN